MLSNELIALAKLGIPISNIYTRFGYHSYPLKDVSELSTVRVPVNEQEMEEGLEYYTADYNLKFRGNSKLTEMERKTEELFWYKDARLMHLNEGYKLSDELSKLRKET